MSNERGAWKRWWQGSGDPATEPTAAAPPEAQPGPTCADELEALKRRLLLMGGAAEHGVRIALRAVVDRDVEALRGVKAGDAAINDLQREIDDRCFQMLARHRPLGEDLRFVVSAVKINADLERVGDLAVNIAEAGERYLAHPPMKVLAALPPMGALAEKMLRDALDAFVAGNISTAQQVLLDDDGLDAQKDRVVRDVLTCAAGDARLIEPGLDLILIARHLERVGDHATNIAEDVIFIVDARDVRHHGGGIGNPQS